MRKKLSSAIIIFSLAVFFLLNTIPIASAEEAGPVYFSIFGGYVMPQGLEIEGHGAVKDVKLDDSWAVGAKAGYIIPAVKWLAVELEYTYLADQNIENGGDGDFNAHNAMANLIFRYPQGRVHPYVGGGLGWSWAEIEGKYAGISFDANDSAFAWQLIAGVKFDITSNFSLDLGYKYFTSEYDVASDGQAKDNLIMLGLGYAFGSEKPTPTVTIYDSDRDGVPDNKDLCPDTPEGAKVNRDGCPVDSDGDGVADYLDKCPGTPKGVKVDGNGCPLDSDRDGVPDYLDKCPDTPYGTSVDKDGCPPVMEEAMKPAAQEEAVVRADSDGDGVYDDLDKCPGTPAGVQVDKDGCPLDSDRDGVPDYLDKCPGTPAGVKVDQEGCPPPVVEKIVPQAARAMEAAIVEKGRVTLNVEFDFNKAIIKKKYHHEIGNLADVMKKYPDLKITIEGHTDNVGGLTYNEKLSQSRADAVKQYLVEKFSIEASRLNAKGYGKIRPIDSNATKAGRQKNRRVEAAADYVIKK